MIKQRLASLLNGKPEQRAYTDLLTQAILSRASGIDTVYSGALEIAAGFILRVFVSATPSGADARYFNASVMSEIGRDLIECGESVWTIAAFLTSTLSPSLATPTAGQRTNCRRM